MCISCFVNLLILFCIIISMIHIRMLIDKLIINIIYIIDFFNISFYTITIPFLLFRIALYYKLPSPDYPTP